MSLFTENKKPLTLLLIISEAPLTLDEIEGKPKELASNSEFDIPSKHEEEHRA